MSRVVNGRRCSKQTTTHHHPDVGGCMPLLLRFLRFLVHRATRVLANAPLPWCTVLPLYSSTLTRPSTRTRSDSVCV